MSLLRRSSTPRLAALLAAVVLGSLVAAVAAVVASGGGGATPATEPLATAVHDALVATRPAGVTARVSFANNLLPTGSLTGNVTSALLSGATGRLWTTSDGRGRIELQSDAGDTQITWTPAAVQVYDASSNTVYRYPLTPKQGSPAGADAPPTLADVTNALAKVAEHWLLPNDATGVDLVGQPAYAATIAPKENGGLFGDGELAWDATHGVPLRIAVTAKGDPTPVLELKVTDIAFGAVAPGDVDVAPPAGAKVVDLSAQAPGTGKEPALTFDAVAPATVGGRTLSSKRAVSGGYLLTYGDGLGALVVHEARADGSKSPLPPALETPLGTVLSFERNGVAFVVGGSMTRPDAETAAAAFGR